MFFMMGITDERKDIVYKNSRCLRIGFIIFIRMNVCLDPAF